MVPTGGRDAPQAITNNKAQGRSLSQPEKNTMDPKGTVLMPPGPITNKFGQFRSCLQAAWHTCEDCTACRPEGEEVEGIAFSLSPSFPPFLSSDNTPAASAPSQQGA